MQGKTEQERGEKGGQFVQVSGRKLAAEACLVSLLAPMVSATSPLGVHMDRMLQAGWCGWSASGLDTAGLPSVPDARTLSRYMAALRTLPFELAYQLLLERMRELLRDREAGALESVLNAKRLRQLLTPAVPWIQRQHAAEMLQKLLEEGWLGTSGRRSASSCQPRAASGSPDLRLLEAYMDVFPALASYTDVQPGAVVGAAWMVASPETLERFSASFDDRVSEVLEGADRARCSVSRDRWVVLRFHRMTGPVVSFKWPGTVIESEAQNWVAEANAEVELLAPFVAAGAIPGWGDLDEAWRGLKGAVGLQLQQAYQREGGGVFRCVHRAHGLGYGTLSDYLDGPVLIGRSSGRIRTSKESECATLEIETLRLLSQIYPESRSERWLWAQVSEKAESSTLEDYGALMTKLVREGLVVITPAGMGWQYRVPSHHQERPSRSQWNRWQRLWRWLEALRSITRAIRRGLPGAGISRQRWVVDREDLPRIEAQIQRAAADVLIDITEPVANVAEVDLIEKGGINSQIVMFTRQEPWLLAQLEEV